LDPELREAIEVIAEAHQTTMSGIIFGILNDSRDQIRRYSSRLAAAKRERERLKKEVSEEYDRMLQKIETINNEVQNINYKTASDDQQMYINEIIDMSKKLKKSLEASNGADGQSK
jgi:phage-related tail protein